MAVFKNIKVRLQVTCFACQFTGEALSGINDEGLIEKYNMELPIGWDFAIRGNYSANRVLYCDRCLKETA